MDQTATGANAVRHPLFAALLGQTIRDGRSDPSHWTRRDLIKHYFDKPSRLPWCEDKEGEDRGIWIEAYIAAATLLRGVPFATLRKNLPGPIRRDRGYISRADFIEQAASRLVSSADRKTLNPLEPDILGENFLLQFFKIICRDEQTLSSFSNVLFDCIATGREEESTLNLVETFQRLVRNLLNDDQKLEEVEDSWDILDAFLRAEHFSHGTLRQAVSIIRADTVKQCRAAKQIERAAQFAENVNIEDIRAASSGPFWLQAATAFMHYFDWQSHQSKIRDDDVFSLVDIGTKFRDRSEKKSPVFLLAASEGCLETAKSAHKEFEEDINAGQPHGWTVLMAAAYHGHTEVVEWLIRLKADPNLSRLDNNWTALMAACAKGHKQTAALLLNAGATVNQGMTDDGATALKRVAFNRTHILRL